jgi:hypothetical protein
MEPREGSVVEGQGLVGKQALIRLAGFACDPPSPACGRSEEVLTSPACGRGRLSKAKAGEGLS